MGSDQSLAHLIDPTRFAAARDPKGRRWISQLPDLVDLMCGRWGLERERGQIRNGYSAVVIPVRNDSGPLVLKLTWPAQGVADEVRGLEVWDGNGMVRMFAADVRVGALLLERLDSDRTLLGLEAMDAVRIAGKLLRRLTIPAPTGFATARMLVKRTARSLHARQARVNCPVPPDWLETAVRLARYLATHAGTDRLIHADFHYDNILAGSRAPWLAIDPRPVAGEPERAVPELLWTRHDLVGDEAIQRMFAELVDSAELDVERTHSWVIVRCVDYWLWGLEHGLTEDPKRCRRILQALVR